MAAENDQPITDSELMNFDRSRLADGDTADFDGMLIEFGDHYRDHLMIAEWIDGWRTRLNEASQPRRGENHEYDRPLREIIAHLRQGDFLPGHVFARPYGSTASQ